MHALRIPLVCAGLFYLALLFLNEHYDLFRDRFASFTSKIIAYVWLGLFLFLMLVLVVVSSQRQPTMKQLAAAPFYELFGLHIVLIVFLTGWWLLTGRPPLLRFLSIQREGVGHSVLIGLAVGVGGWIVTLLFAGMIALILKASGLMPTPPTPAPFVFFLASMPLWKKIVIVLSAMTVEEAFFRGWLQKRLGLLASTALFALAHAGLGQPFLLIGVTIISLIIGFTFYRTKNLLPGVIAHGVFDAVQLFVIIPMALKVSGM